MNKLAGLIANGEISVEELANAPDLIERAKLVMKGIEACKKTLLFPLGVQTICCYSYRDSAGEYEAWGNCDVDGTFVCFCNWGGNHEIGRCNLLDFQEVFMTFENEDFSHNMHRFLLQQIDKAEEAE